MAPFKKWQWREKTSGYFLDKNGHFPLIILSGHFITLGGVVLPQHFLMPPINILSLSLSHKIDISWKKYNTNREK